MIPPIELFNFQLVSYWLDFGTLAGVETKWGFLPWVENVTVSVEASSFWSAMNDSSFLKELGLRCVILNDICTVGP